MGRVLKMKVIPSFEKLNKQVLEGNASWGSIDYGIKFARYIDGLPWNGTRPDWNKIDSRVNSIDLYSSNEEEIKGFGRSSALSGYDKVGLLYLDRTPLLIVESDLFIKDISSFLTYSGDAMAFGFNKFGEEGFKDFMMVFAWQADAIAK